MIVPVTAYIPCYNATRYLEETLQAIFEQSCVPAEILVIDDGSTDHSVEVAQRFPVEVIRHGTNKGLAAARNTAIGNAHYELLAAVDADVVVEPDWLEWMLAALSDDEISGVGSKLIERFQDTPANRWRALHMIQDLGAKGFTTKNPEYQNIYLSGFGTLFRKSALREVGGYNELYRTNFEDADIGQRLLDAGHVLAYEPRAIAYHIRCDTPHSVARMAWRWDFWPQYYNGGYQSISKKLRQNLVWTKDLMLQHIKMRDLKLLKVDLVYMTMYCYWDLKYTFSIEHPPTAM